MKIHKDITLAGCTSSVQNGKVHLIKINSNTKKKFPIETINGKGVLTKQNYNEK